MRAALCLVLVALISAPAFARHTIPESVDDFETALDQRIGDIGALPSPTAGELKEKSGLEKARAILGPYAGTADKVGLSVVAKALGTAYKATMDPDMVIAGENVKNSYIGEGEYRQGLAQSAQGLLQGDAAKAKVDAAIAKAAGLFAPANLEPDWGAAAKLATKGILALDKSRMTVGKYLEKEMADRDPYFTAEWPGMAFSAPPAGCYATWYADAALQLYGQGSGAEPHYIVMVPALNVFGVGRYAVPVNWTALQQWTGYTKTDSWQSLDGSILLLVLTKKVAAGTFYFSAQSTSSGVVSVTNGNFLVPIVE